MLERLRAGAGYDEVARDERISERRVRQIVTEHLKRREAESGATHANLQLDRLGFAMRVASAALASGDVRAVAPFVKVIDRLDRYQELAREAAPQRNTEADALVVKEIVRRIRGAYDHELKAGAKAAALVHATPDASLNADAVSAPDAVLAADTDLVPETDLGAGAALGAVPPPAPETEAAPPPPLEPGAPWRPRPPIRGVDFMSGLR